MTEYIIDYYSFAEQLHSWFLQSVVFSALFNLQTLIQLKSPSQKIIFNENFIMT